MCHVLGPSGNLAAPGIAFTPGSRWSGSRCRSWTHPWTWTLRSTCHLLPYTSSFSYHLLPFSTATQECITDTCAVLGFPLIAHHISLEIFICIPAGSNTQQLSSPHPRVPVGSRCAKSSNHAWGIPHSLSLSITSPCFWSSTAHNTIWNCFLCLLVCLCIISP